jgi:hypothetical protein
LSQDTGQPCECCALQRIATSASSWHAYDADRIFSPGQMDTGSGHVFVNEDIDARAAAEVAGWRLPAFDPSAWDMAEVRYRDTSDCHFRKTATEYDMKSGIKWLSCTAK